MIAVDRIKMSLTGQAGRTRARVRTLVMIRWLAIAGQSVSLIVVAALLEVEMAMTPAVIAVACSAVLNLFIGWRLGLNGWHNELEAMGFLGYDILQLSVLLYLTGGLHNPFAVLLLAPVTISATILGVLSTVGLGVLAFVCVSFLAFHHLPMPWPFGVFDLPPSYSLAIWLALTVCMTFLMFYAWRVAQESRRMSDALAATQLALAREQELSSLGALAAGAAHALGTPLGTIALVVKEMRHETEDSDDMADDLVLLQGQVDRCRNILSELSNRGYAEEDPQFNQQSMNVIAMTAAEPYRQDGIVIQGIEKSHDRDDRPPLLRRSPELLQGLSNIIENAVDFARERVEIESDWDDQQVILKIRDDGPGFAADIYAMLGDPYVSTRRERGGMGLGVFISKTLLERTGATVRFANVKGGHGAEVTITWQRSDIEVRE